MCQLQEKYCKRKFNSIYLLKVLLGHLLNIPKKFENSRETGNLQHLYTNDLEKACFAHDAAYSDSEDLAKRTISDKIVKEKASEIARNPKYYGYQTLLASMVYRCFDKKTGSGVSVNEQLAEELHKLNEITNHQTEMMISTSLIVMHRLG